MVRNLFEVPSRKTLVYREIVNARKHGYVIHSLRLFLLIDWLQPEVE